MKKQLMRIAALAVLTGTLVCSCEKEKDIEATYTLDSGNVALVMDQATTRASGGTTLRVNSYSVGKDSQGNELCLEEIVTEMGDLGEASPETRGTPAYTQNVTDVFGNSFSGVLYGPSGEIAGDESFTVMDGTGPGGKKVWRRVFDFNPFTKSDPLYFFLRMPETPTGVSNLTYNYNNGSIAFDYESPATAATQQDILFAARQLSEETYLQEFKTNGGASVLFRHALTGVKFAIGNNNTAAGARHPEGVVETFITQVTVKGLKNKGHAVFVPVGTENTDQVDDINEHTSAGSFTWTNLTGGTTVSFTQTYGENDIQDFQQDANDKVGAPESFYAAGADRNLNKADASLTFWFIPQDMTEDVIVSVKFKIWDGQALGEEETLDLNLGAMILEQADKAGYTNKSWKAGQLRTFKLVPNLVDVDITDDVDGFTKDNVVIRNTGNVKAFIRAYIVANWFGATESGEDGIALGYESATSENYVKSWQMTGTTGDNYGGVFTSLPGSGWVRGTDGFFYFTTAVDPGQPTDTPLFDSYHLETENVPEIWYLDSSRKPFKDVRLVMEIPVQAIQAKDGYTYKQAWMEAGVAATVFPN